MKIEILGMGCPKCQELYENAQKAAKEAGMEAVVMKVEDADKITEYGVFVTPALVMNGQVKASGEVVPSEQIKQWMQSPG